MRFSKLTRGEGDTHVDGLMCLLYVTKHNCSRYKDAQRAYVTQYFGRPLEKLNVFFEGIQQLVATGIKESEISYQLAFSKQELRKVRRNSVVIERDRVQIAGVGMSKYASHFSRGIRSQFLGCRECHPDVWS